MSVAAGMYQDAMVEEPSEEDAQRNADDIVAADVDIGHCGLPSWPNSNSWIKKISMFWLLERNAGGEYSKHMIRS